LQGFGVGGRLLSALGVEVGGLGNSAVAGFRLLVALAIAIVV
jgi:hypothetical protein